MKQFLTLVLSLFLITCSFEQRKTNLDKNSNKAAVKINYKVHDYKELEKLDIVLPYVYQYSNNEQSILVYGSYHTSNPKDSIINHIESTIEKFKPDLILYEGDGISFEKSKEETIRYYFEMGWVRFLSHRNKILDLNIEPLASDKYEYILKKHPKSEVFLATIGLQLTLLLISDESVDFEQFYKQFIKTIQKEGFPITNSMTHINYFYKIYENFYGIPFDLESFDYETVEIKFNKTLLNQINQETAQFRDQHMLKQIDSLFTDYNRIYVQIGGRHAIVWESAIRKIVEKESRITNKNTTSDNTSGETRTLNTIAK